jgi:hypothetical protein
MANAASAPPSAAAAPAKPPVFRFVSESWDFKTKAEAQAIIKTALVGSGVTCWGIVGIRASQALPPAPGHYVRGGYRLNLNMTFPDNADDTATVLSAIMEDKKLPDDTKIEGRVCAILCVLAEFRDNGAFARSVIASLPFVQLLVKQLKWADPVAEQPFVAAARLLQEQLLADAFEMLKLKPKKPDTETKTNTPAAGPDGPC